MDFLNKINENPYEDLTWNIPEQPMGTINVVGGNAQSFRTSVKAAEYLSGKFPIKKINVVFPDALKNKLPPLDNFVFLPSTDSGSFGDCEELTELFKESDYNLVIGDLSKNSITAKALNHAYKNSTPCVITRDSVDLFTEESPEKTLMNENLVLFGSMVEMQKLFRSVYYPKVLLISQSLMQVAEALHKFTLSYPVSLITLHNGQVLVAKNGQVNVVPLEKTGYAPLTIWNGELASKIVAMNLFNPDNFLDATVAALFLR